MLIDIEIKGDMPMIQNRFTEAAQGQADKGSGARRTGGNKPAPKKQAEAKLYIGSEHGDHAGKPTIPAVNLLRCLAEGGRFFKIGREKITTQKRSYVYSCCRMQEAELLIRSKNGWHLDSRPVVVPATGGRITAHRPMWNDWSIKFQIELDEDFMAEDLLREIVDAAGRRIGLGDYRPDCKGPYGIFKVIHWKVDEKSRKVVDAA